MKPEVDYLKDPRYKAALEQVKHTSVSSLKFITNSSLIHNSLKGRLPTAS